MSEQAELPVWEPTGDPRVDDAVGLLQGLANLPVADHADVLTDVHRRLRDALAESGGAD